MFDPKFPSERTPSTIERATLQTAVAGMRITPTVDEAIEVIVREVTNLQGCKATDLAASRNLVGYDVNWPRIIEEAVRRGRLIEVEYVLPTMDYRAKSFLLPAGTRVEIIPSD